MKTITYAATPGLDRFPLEERRKIWRSAFKRHFRKNTDFQTQVISFAPYWFAVKDIMREDKEFAAFVRSNTKFPIFPKMSPVEILCYVGSFLPSLSLPFINPSDLGLFLVIGLSPLLVLLVYLGTLFFSLEPRRKFQEYVNTQVADSLGEPSHEHSV